MCGVGGASVRGVSEEAEEVRRWSGRQEALTYSYFRVHKPKRRQYLEDEHSEVNETPEFIDLSNDEKLELLDFEEKCCFFGHVKLMAMEIHKMGKQDTNLKTLVGDHWKSIKGISEVTQDMSQTKVPTTNLRRYRLISSVGDQSL